MNPPSRYENELLFDCCVDLICSDEAADVEALVHRSELTAGMYRRIQAALGPLKNLYPKPCPEELAERTIRRLCAAAREPREAARERIIHLHVQDREDVGLWLSSNIPVK